MFTQFFKYGNIFSGVEHSFNISKEPVFNILSLKKEKKELGIVNKAQFFNQEDVFSFLDTEKHVFLTINNEQVLTKKSAFYDENPLNIVKQTFQNINNNDFYYQVDGDNQNSFVTICRRKYIDDLISEYSKRGIAVIGFALGNSIVKNISPYINKDVFYTSNAKIALEKGSIDSIESEFESSDYIINGLEVSNNDIVSLSGILYGYLQNGDTQIGFKDKIEELKKDFLDKRIFKVGLNFSLGLLLVLLLGNFMLFSSYSSKIKGLSDVLSVDENQKIQVTRLKENIATKETLIKDLNNVLQSNISKRIDEIAVSVPLTILLEELSYQPLKSTVRFDKKMLFNKQNILVKGVTKKDTDFSLWTTALGEKNWIKEIIFQDLSKGKKGHSTFEFLIKLKNE